VTYGGLGTAKYGCHTEDHAIIYSTEFPILQKDEGELGYPPIFCKMKEGHQLDSASRLNFAKVYTVEHNVKTQFIGQVADEYEQSVVSSYNKAQPPLPNRTPASDFVATERSGGYPPSNWPSSSTVTAPSFSYDISSDKNNQGSNYDDYS
jgi:hypothetical protein